MTGAPSGSGGLEPDAPRPMLFPTVGILSLFFGPYAPVIISSECCVCVHVHVHVLLCNIPKVQST